MILRDEHLRMKGLRRVRGRDMLGLNDAPENAALCPIPVEAWDRGAGRYVRRVEGMEAPGGWEPAPTL